MNIRVAALLLPLAGCGAPASTPQARDADAADAAPTSAPVAEADDGKVECTTGGAPFERACSIERSDSPRGRLLTLRRPDGGFRRLLITKDGRGVVAADGAEAARVTILAPDRIEVAIGGDRYRLPAAIRQ
jgi:hypothetical protein